MVDFPKNIITQLIIGFLLSSCTCTSAQKDQSIIIGMYYHDARKLIIQSGWEPADNMPPYEEIGADAHYLRDLGYAEVDDCTGAGVSLCNFYFQNEKGEYLRIGTEGEYYDPNYEFQTRVVYAHMITTNFNKTSPIVVEK